MPKRLLAYRQALLVLVALGILAMGTVASLAVPTPLAPTVTTPANGSAVGTTPTYSGTSQAGSTVTVVVDGSSIGSTSTDGSGAWSFLQPTPLAQGSHTVYANAQLGNSPSSPNSATNTFSSFAPPSVTGVSPNSDSTAGGATVTITGSNFAGATAVSFGGTFATSFIVTSNTQITAVTPAHAAGSVDVTVQTAGGTGTLAGGFTYIAPPTANDQSVAVASNTATAITLTASGSPTSYTVATAPAHGTLTGTAPNLTYTPSAGYGGADSFQFYASNAAGNSNTAIVSITVTPPTILVAPNALPNGTPGTAYSQTITASGGTAPYNFTLAGTLPPGLSLANGGTLTGTPTASGTFSFRVTATDANGYAGFRDYTLTVTAPTITLAPATLPPATVGALYGQTITATGGTAPYTYSITGGALPAGLTLTAGGVLNGTPTAGGSFSFTVTARDANRNPGTQSYTLTVAAPTIALAPGALPPATVGQSYGQTITATGGTAPYSFAVTGNAVPSGLTLSSNGTLSGTPTAAGNYTFTVTARDSSTGTGPYTGQRSYSVTIAAASTTTALTASPNPSTSGQTVTLTATVTASAGTPTGTVTFASNGATLGQAPLSGGVATLNTAALPLGADTVTATYGGSANFSASSGQTTQQVNLAATTTTATSTPNPSIFGQTVTLQASVTSAGGTPTGTVTFTSGSYASGPVALANGTATITTAALPVGSNTITATYSGATNFAGSTGTTTQVVNKVNTSTALTSTPNPSTFGQSVTFTATVTGQAPGGTVTFSEGGTTLSTGTLANGQAIFSTATLAPGPHQITASYGGDAGNNGSSSSALTQNVNAAGTTTAVSGNPNPSAFGQSITITATVTVGIGAPTGTVTFTSGGRTLGTAPVSGGTASIATSALPAGSNTVTATYAPASGFAASSGSYTQAVNAVATVTALTVAPNPSMFGQAVTLTARVTSTGGAPTGTVTFTNGQTVLGAAALSNGVATLTTSALPVGTTTITASYPTTGGFAGSSGTAAANVGGAATTTALTASPNPSRFGQSITFTATVTSAGGTPTGTVTFTSNGAQIGQATLSGGTASISSTALPAGTNTVTANYGGATNFGSSTGTTTQTVNVANTATGLTSAPNPSTAGQSVTLTATITSAGGTPTGTVTFTNGGTTLGTTTLTNGVATLATANLPVGTSTLTASYGGAGSFGASSGTAAQTVNAANTITALTSSPNPSLPGQAVTFTATVTGAGGTPTGTVTFTSGGTALGTAALANGTATLSVSTLPVGTSTLTASYGGAGSFGASSGTTTQTVNAANTTTALTSSANPSTFGQSVTFTATVKGQSPTGTVTFQDGGATLGTVALANGTASLSTAALSAGPHTITVVYAGDPRNTTSTSPGLTQSVSTAATTTTLASSRNPSILGQAVRFTATVTGPSGTPTGNVTFRDGGTTLGTVALANGTASLSTADLSAGTHTITAAYGGDPSFTASTSAALSQQVKAVVGGVTLTIVTAGRDGSFSFASTLPGATAITLATSGNRASRTFTNVPSGTYTITSLGVPPGFAAQGFTCTGGTAGANGAVTFPIMAGASVSCTFNASFDEAAIRRTTQAAIRSFLQQRAEVIAQAQPETRRFHDRFSGSLFGDDSGMSAGLSYAQNPIDITGSTTLGGTNLSGTTSLSRIMRPDQKLEFDAWFDVRSGTYRDATEQGPLSIPTVGLRSRYSGSFTLAFAGVDYRLAPSVLVGLLGQFDQVRQNTSSLGNSASGTGYMVGPYLSMALTPGLFLDVRAAYGMSSNVITPSGLLQSSFSTDRQLYRAELSGLYRLGDLSVLPSVSALYFSERQLAFTDTLAVRIPGQRVGLGQIAVGPEFSYNLATPYGLIVPRFATRAIYNVIRDDEASPTLSIVRPTGPLRARLEGGIDLQDFFGFILGTSIAYDGIGDAHYSAKSGRINLRKQF